MPVSRPALHYTGGKWMSANWIISQFPNHHCYVEPYCGGASVLLRKEPSYFEVMNDLDGDVINFFRVLRENYDEFIRVIQLTPWSREEARYKPSDDDSNIERARKFYTNSWQARSRTGWRYQFGTLETYSVVQQFNNMQPLLDIVQRLKNVQLDCDEATKVIKRFDAPHTLFYVDPPYVTETRAKNIYRKEMTDQDHISLWETLLGVSGRVVLSGYPSALYQEYGKNWRTVQKPSKTNGKKAGTEVLWMNF